MFALSVKSLRFYCSLAIALSSLFFNNSSSEIIVPPIILLSINHPNKALGLLYNSALPPSIFYAESSLSSLIQNKDKKSSDYLITGAIFTNCNNLETICGQVFAQISPGRLYLYNQSSHRIKVSFRGKIANQEIRANKNTKVNFRKNQQPTILPWKAGFKIIGDIDESTITAENSSGKYTGIFNIRVFLI